MGISHARRARRSPGVPARQVPAARVHLPRPVPVRSARRAGRRAEGFEKTLERSSTQGILRTRCSSPPHAVGTAAKRLPFLPRRRGQEAARAVDELGRKLRGEATNCTRWRRGRTEIPARRWSCVERRQRAARATEQARLMDYEMGSSSTTAPRPLLPRGCLAAEARLRRQRPLRLPREYWNDELRDYRFRT